MSLAGQNPQPNRHLVVPRTLTFLFRGNEVLLLRLAPTKGAWGGLLNGVGGHLEATEGPLASAKREIQEETGLIPGTSLRLCGLVHVDTGSSPGILLMVFAGEAPHGMPRPSQEGSPEWVDLSILGSLPLVEDLTQLIPAAAQAYRSGTTFSAHYHYDKSGMLKIEMD